jgi:excisionase family DNA binding protein
MSANGTKRSLMTLSEASKFLNIREPMLETLAKQKRVPARKIGKAWRFSRTRLERWMRDEREPSIALLQLAGTWKDDPDIMEILKDIYKSRERPEREEE